MHLKADHSKEVEQRIAAIRVCPFDRCLFFVRKDKALISLRQCIYCAYGAFEGDGRDIQEQGLCKYKR